MKPVFVKIVHSISIHLFINIYIPILTKMYKMAHFHPNSASENGQKSPITFVGFSTSSTLPKSYTFQNYPYGIYKKEACEHPILNIVQKTSPYNCSKLNKLWWWQPIQDSIPAQFLEASSMHGLKYVSQPKRHIIERYVK